MKFPRHFLAGALAAGLALAPADEITAFAVAMALLVILLAARSRSDVAVAAAALLIAGAALGGARLDAIDADPLARLGGSASLTGTLVQVPVRGEHGVRARMRVAGQTIELRANVLTGGVGRIGDEVRASGRLVRIDPRGASSHEARSYAHYLLRNGVRRRLIGREALLTGDRRGGAKGVVDGIRNRSDSALAFGLAPEPAALLRGMVLGGDNGIPERTVEDFRVAGLAHILAVSGQNVLLIVILLQAICAALAVPRNARLLASAGVICIYVLLCGAQASVVRAGAMGLAGVAAMAASRPSSRVYALFLAAIAVLAWNPRATADVGAQLSFAAVLGIMAFTVPLARRLTALPRWAAEAFAATAGATIATAPLMALHFGQLSLVSLAANVLGEPLIGPIVWLGSLTAAIGQLSLPLASLLGAPNQFLLGALIELAHFSAGVPSAQIAVGGFGAPAAVGALGLVALLAAFARDLIPTPRPGSTTAAYGGVTLAAIIVFVVVLLAGGRASPIERPAIVMLDVGQGDATLLLGASGCSVLIDGGPPDDDLAAKVRATGVDRLSAVLATHPETDHFGGVLDLTRDRALPVSLFLDTGGNTPRPDYAELRQRFAQAGVPSQPVASGLHWGCGDISIDVLGPAEQPPDAPPPGNPNTRAAVTSIAVGPLTMLASGDAESPQLLSLPLPRADVLKVPHHGSDDPGLPAVLERVRPRVAMIGVGKRNRFGHPTPSTLSALAAAGVEVHRTDVEGRIVVRPGAR